MIAKVQWFDPTLIQTEQKSVSAGMVRYIAYGEVEECEDRYIIYCAYPVAEIKEYEATGKTVGFVIPRGPGVKITPMEVVSDGGTNDPGGKREPPDSREVGGEGH